MVESCPECSAPGKVVTAVTISTLGSNPRKILVTLQCTASHCHHKFPVMKAEQDLTDADREVWRNP